MPPENDLSFVEYVVKAVVNYPDAVKVSRAVDEMGVLISIKVDPSDMGLLIGRAGSTAKAIRTLARMVGMKDKARVNLRIIEPEGSGHQPNYQPRTKKSVEDIDENVGSGI